MEFLYRKEVEFLARKYPKNLFIIEAIDQLIFHEDISVLEDAYFILESSLVLSGVLESFSSEYLELIVIGICWQGERLAKENKSFLYQIIYIMIKDYENFDDDASNLQEKRREECRNILKKALHFLYFDYINKPCIFLWKVIFFIEDNPEVRLKIYTDEFPVVHASNQRIVSYSDLVKSMQDNLIKDTF